jgi:hypothetical protein
MFPVLRTLSLLLLGCWLVAPAARAQYENEEESRVWLRALLDVRVARGGSSPSWTDHGPGRTRYGGDLTDGASEAETRFALAQLALQLGATLPWDVRAQIQANVQPDVADSYTPWLVEAFLRKEWQGAKNGWGLQAGLMNTPFSLERTGPAWTPEYLLSSSALDTWLWEETSLAGLEGEWWYDTERGPRLGLIVGAGYGPDQFGRLLALRGWVIGDHVIGSNGDLPLPNGTRTEIFDERDDRVAAYAMVSLSDRQERGAIKIGYFDNMGDQGVAGVWHTHFTTIGVVLHPLPSLDVVAQYLSGDALVASPSNDSELRAYYGLLSYRYRRHRLTARYDEFRLEDLDGGNSTRESGDGVTLCYSFEWGLRHRLGLEYVWLDTERPASAQPEPDQDGWQISYRFRY